VGAETSVGRFADTILCQQGRGGGRAIPPRRRGGWRDRLVVSIAALAVAVGALGGLTSASAATGAEFTVTSAADAVDAGVGNGSCATSTGACTLRAAIQEANAIPGHDTIRIPAGTYAIAIAPQNTNLAESGDFDITGSVTIIGDGPGSTILDGGAPSSSAPEIRGRDRIIEVHASAAEVVVTGLSVQEGYSAEHGGAISTTSSGVLRLVNVHVRDSYAAKYGGGLANAGVGRVELVGSRMSGNGAKEGGSAIHNHVDGTVSIADASEIVDNPGASISAYPITGAAVNNEGEGDTVGTIEVLDSTIARNESSSNGGGIRNDRDGRVVVRRSTITGNRTSSSGAGIYSVSGEILVAEGSSISANHAGNLISSGDGGGVYMAGGTTKAGAPARVEIVDSTIADNTAQADGAGIYSGLDADLRVTRSTVSGNAAEDAGGGVSVQARADVLVTDATFADNSAGVAGGGAHTYAEGTATFANTTFDGNVAGETGGGGLSSDGSGTVLVQHSVFRDNSSVGDGGGMWISTSGQQTISDTTVTENHSDEGGGGIFNSGMSVTLERLLIRDNTALLDGGGIKSEGSGLLAVLDTTVAGNTAENGGGFANEADGTMQVSGSVFMDNAARLDGGGYFEVSDANAEVVNSTLSHNSAGDRGGGLYVNADATLQLTNVTITDNSALAGSGVSTSVESLNFPVLPASAVILRNTIVAANHDGINCHGAVFSEGGNLDDGTTCFFDDSTDITRTGPGLEALSDNGGQTLTHALRSTSVAIDRGVAPCPDLDQRAVTRPQNEGCDIGAYEFEGQPGEPEEDPLPPPTGPDTDPPVVTLDAKPAPRTTDMSAEFRFRANEIARFECVLDPPVASFSGCESPHDYTNLALGPHTFQVRAVDAASNVGAVDSYTWRVVLELVSPETAIGSGPDALTRETSAAFAFSADEPATFECSLDGAAYASCTSPRTLGGLADGQHTFAVRATDEWFNVDETPATAVWTVDTTPPETAIESGPAGPTNDATPTFDLSASEDGSTFACSLDGVEYGACAAAFTTAPLADGDYTLHVRATDPAGNTDGSPAARAFTVDTVAPETAIDGGPSGFINQPSVSFTFSADESSAFACALDDAAFVSCGGSQAYEGVAEGAHTFRVRATDAAGNTDASPASRSFTVDTVAPETAIDSGPQALTRETSATFTFSSSEAATHACSLDGAAFADCGSPAGYPALDDGEHVFLVRATDTAGNEETAAAIFVWTVDTTAPVTSISSGPPTLTNASTASFAFTSTEEGSTFTCSLDAAEYSSCESGVAYTGLVSGEHTFSVRATDPAGNTDESAASRTWTIDTDPPDTGIATGPAALSSSSAASFSLTSTEAGSTFACALDGSAFTACANPASYVGLADGEHTFEVLATDPAGNMDATAASRTWTIDTTAPETSIVDAPAALTNLSGASFDFASSESGSTFACSLDGAAFTGCESQQAYADLADGEHVFLVRATDRAGNADASAAIATWTVDTTAPTTSIVAAPPAQTSATDASIEFASSEAGSSFACSLDGVPLSPCGSPASYVDLEEGAHIFAVVATDAAGNADPTAATSSWTVDVTAPETSITASPPALAASASAGFSFTSSEDGSSFACSLDAAPFADCESPVAYAGLGEGDHTFAVRATDGAGNSDSSAATRSWTIDTTAPDTSITASPPAFSSSASATFSFASTDGGSSFACSLDGAEYAACASGATYAGLVDGAHTFSVRATDEAGNADGSAASYSWTVDTVPPQTTITDGPPALTDSAAATLSFASSDAGSTLDCSLDGEVLSPCTSPVSYTGLGDGQHTFAVRATDAAGNLDASPATRTWTVDTTAPDTTITASPSTLSGSAGASFEFGSTTAGATFACSLDGAAFTTCESPRSYAGLVDGEHTFAVRASDPAGNSDASPASHTWRVDTTPPQTSITGAPPALQASADATLTFASSETGSSFECSLDGAALSPCVSPDSHSGLADGEHTFSVVATDAAGNSDPTAATATWTVDTSSPDTSITDGPPALTTSASASFSFDSTQAGATFACSLDGAGFSACTSPQTYTTLADGPHTFAVRATDSAGNADESPATRAWTIDTVAPDTTITSGPPATTTSTSASFDLSASESGSTFACSLDGAAFAACTSPHQVSGLGLGPHQLRVRATDAAGNADGTPASHSWTVQAADTTAPETTITAGPTGPTNDATPTFEFTASEAATFHCRVDAASFAPCSSPHTTSTLGEGAHTFEVRATDSAGNVDQSAASRAFTVDTAGPQTTITAGPPATTTSTTARFEFTSTEQGSLFECSLDGSGFVPCSSPVTYTVGTGSHQFQVRARDAAGNVDGSPASSSWTVQAGDTGSPETSITGGPDGATNDSTPTFTFSSSETGSTFQCRVDSGSFASCSSPHTTATLAQGAHTWEVRAIDAAGNVDQTPALRSIVVDTAAPDTTITAGPSGSTNDATPTFEFTATETATFQCRVDTGTFTNCSSPHTTASVTTGSHTFEVRAVDSAGNVDGSPASRAFSVDTTAPNTTITEAPPATTQSATVGFQFTASETGSSFECSLDGSGFVPCSSPVTYTVSPGPHQFQVRARDVAGNTDGSPASASWTYQAADTVPPETTITNGPPETTQNATVSFEFTSSETGSSFACSLDGAGFVPCSSPVSYTVSVGSHEVQVRATDAAGNIDQSPASRSWTREEPPPGACTPSTITLGASADSWILQTSSSSNYGNDSVLKVDSKMGAPARTLVRFTLPALPAGCQVLDAELRLYAGSYKTGRTIDVYALTSAWGESSVTWGNQPVPAGSASGVASGSGYLEWNVTAQLASTYAANTGFLVRDRTDDRDGFEQGFHSREKGTDNPPRLVISFGS
jgi:CSLREA domain-containing protein